MSNVNLPAGTSSGSVAVGPGLVVGAVYSESTLQAALSLEAPPAAPDLLELRIDHFAARPAALDPLAANGVRRLIMTVRDAREGGHGELGPARRAALYERFMPAAYYADLELSCLSELPAAAAAARLTPGGLIASFHDFAGTPARERLHELAGQAAGEGAAIFKVAVCVENARQLAVLFEFLGAETRLPLAVMGMGPLGRLSRLAAAAVGSRLSYGYLGESPQVPGQWPVSVLRARISELLPTGTEAGVEVSPGSTYPKADAKRT